MIEIGQLVGGKYRVLRPLGEGGMGIVVAAEHIHVNEPVAIKVLKPDALGRPEMLARFVREARTAMKLKSEHVVRVFDVDMIGGSLPYIVMELLEGRDLASVVADDGPASVRVTIDWVLQACESIAEAHALGVVHRDLKPANLFLTKRPDGSASIKVLDFGVSKVAWAPDEMGAVTEPSSDSKLAVSVSASPKSAGLTNTNATLGSPRYMSPEQLRSARDVDTRADVWALGATLFELLSGRAPFVGTTTEEITARIHNENAPSLRTLRPSLPAGLDAVLARCLRKNPDDRYADVAALASALAPFGSDEGTRSVARVRAILGIEAPPRVRVVRTLGIALGIACVVGVALVTLRERRPTVVERPATPPPLQTATTHELLPTMPVLSAPPRALPATTLISSAGAEPRHRAPAVARDAGGVYSGASLLDPAHAFDQPD